VVVANIEEVQQKKKIVLSFAPSQFRMVAHSLRGQPYNFAVCGVATSDGRVRR
jgi:hypothetical protein